MPQADCLAERFEHDRAWLRAVAYRMLGSLSEADDAVQEAWLRISRAEASGVDNPGGWLSTVVTRVCLNALRAHSTRREEPKINAIFGPNASLTSTCPSLTPSTPRHLNSV